MYRGNYSYFKVPLIRWLFNLLLSYPCIFRSVLHFSFWIFVILCVGFGYRVMTSLKLQLAIDPNS
jgi:hypothetical protein